MTIGDEGAQAETDITSMINTTEEPFSSFEANSSNITDLEPVLENVSVESAGT